MAFLGTGWKHNDECAHPTERMDEADFTLPGISSIFLDIEPLDWGREAGVLPRFTFGDLAKITSARGNRSNHIGKTATIVGHSFNRDTSTWGYAVRIEGEPLIHEADESDLANDSTGSA